MLYLYAALIIASAAFVRCRGSEMRHLIGTTTILQNSNAVEPRLSESFRRSVPEVPST